MSEFRGLSEGVLQFFDKIRREWPEVIVPVRVKHIQQLTRQILRIERFLNKLEQADEHTRDRWEKLAEDVSQQVAEVIKPYVQINFEFISQSRSSLSRIETLPQMELHFMAEEGEAFYVRLIKGFKRLRRFRRKWVNRSANGVRKLFKRPLMEASLFERTVPVRYWAEVHQTAFQEEILRQDLGFIRPALEMYGVLLQLDRHFLHLPELPEVKERQAFRDKLIEIKEGLKEHASTLKNTFEASLEGHIQELQYTLERAGTIALSSRPVTAKALKNLRATYQDEVRKRALRLKKTINALGTQIQVQHQLQTLAEQLQAETEKLTGALKAQLMKGPVAYLEKLEQEAISFLHLLRSSSKRAKLTQAQRKQLTEALEQFDRVNKTISSGMQRTINRDANIEAINELKAEIVDLAKNQAVVVDLIDALRFDEAGLPVHEVEELNWQTELSRYFAIELVRPLDVYPGRIDSLIEQVNTAIAELDEVLEVNLNSALNVSEDDEDLADEKPIDVAIEALGRVQERIAGLQTQVEKDADALCEDLAELVQNKMRFIINKAAEGKLDAIRWKGKELKARETAIDIRVKLEAVVTRALDLVSVWWKGIHRELILYRGKIAPYIGLGSEENVDAPKQIDEYLSELKEVTRSLPFIYRKVFSLQSILEDRFFVDKPSVSASVDSAWEHFKENLPAHLVFIGEKGSGKSTWMRSLLSRNAEHFPTKELNISSTTYTEDAFLAWMSSELDSPAPFNSVQSVSTFLMEQPRQVILIEKIQNLYLRHPDGFEALECFFSLMDQTSGHVFWVCSCSRYSWEFLSKAVHIQGYFTHKASVDQLSDEQIVQLILKRHRTTGFTLVFEDDVHIRRIRAYKKVLDQPEERQEWLEAYYFEQLNKVSEGNASIAIMYWLRSIKEVTDHEIIIAPLSNKIITIAEELSNDAWFTLAFVILHDTVTIEEHSKSFNFPVAQSRLLFARLKLLNLIMGDGTYYQVNDVLFRPIVRELKKRNIFH